MSIPVNPVSREFENLTIELRTTDVARAAEILHRVAGWLVLAGFGHQAHAAYERLLTGPMRLSDKSSLVHPVESVLPQLCFGLSQPCPAMFTSAAMDPEALERYVRDEEKHYVSRLLRDGYSIPLEDWNPDLERRATGETQPPLERRELGRFLTNTQRLTQ